MQKCRDCEQPATHFVYVFTSTFSRFPSVTYECCIGHAENTSRRFERNGHPTAVQHKAVKRQIDAHFGRSKP